LKVDFYDNGSNVIKKQEARGFNTTKLIVTSPTLDIINIEYSCGQPT